MITPTPTIPVSVVITAATVAYQQYAEMLEQGVDRQTAARAALQIYLEIVNESKTCRE